ncbi:uncharacterized protein BDZ99DRAFT_517178 [Mytilinidion resinicola]|uniref:Uncharacterized protein n=1 Tax=Mytilinidion resinicola TaxID=574789 RepID=A0A6A6YWH6_9PEZI|nr:uncharacterized protein BDZ99DRAFT_517178 [Mytilinidion resinicola]KAF2812869.1 hypothetical protein BDZ99DRAFT_517178 [Mytilinidion resinicola]
MRFTIYFIGVIASLQAIAFAAPIENKAIARDDAVDASEGCSADAPVAEGTVNSRDTQRRCII